MSEGYAALTREQRRTAEHWTAQHAGDRGVQWWDLAPVTAYMNRMLSGDSDVGFAEYCVREVLKDQVPVGRCLSLGCGAGDLERNLASLGAFAACDACDLAPGSLEIARSRAREMGYEHINYFQADLNSAEFVQHTYDVILAHGILHHIQNLEHVFQAVRVALKPDGLFLIQEYVGPDRFQFGRRQRELVDSVLRLLPAVYRELSPGAQEDSVRPHYGLARVAAKLRSGRLLDVLRTRLSWSVSRARGMPLAVQSVRFATPADVEAVDPSEAIRSSEILDILRCSFEIVDSRPLGGTLTQPLLSGDIAWNFVGAGNAPALLDMIVKIEETLLACGEIDSDHVFVVARALPV